MGQNDVVSDITDGLETYWNNLTGKTSAEAAKAEAAAQAAKIAEMKAAAGVYGDYRGQQQQARMNALSSISTAYQPANNALATMYGGGMGGGSNYNARPAGYAPITAGMSGAAKAYQAAPAQTFTAVGGANAKKVPGLLGTPGNPTLNLNNRAPVQSRSQTLAKLNANPLLAPKPGAASPMPAAAAPIKTSAAQPSPLIASRAGGAAGLNANVAPQQSMGAAAAKLAAGLPKAQGMAAPMKSLERGISSVGGAVTPGQTDASGNVGGGHIGEDGTYYTPTGIHYGKPVGPGGNGSRAVPPITPGMSIEEANASVPEGRRRNLTGYGNEVKAPGQGYSGQYWVLPPGGDPNDPSTWVFVDEQYLLANGPEYEAWLKSQGLEKEPDSNYVLGAVPRWGAPGSWDKQGAADPGGGGGPAIGAGGPGDPTSQYRTKVNPSQPAFIPPSTGPAGVSFQPTEMLNNPFGNAAGAGGSLPFVTPGSPFRQAEYFDSPAAPAFASSNAAKATALPASFGVAGNPKLSLGGSTQPAQNAGGTLERLRALSRSGVLQKLGQGRP